MILATIARVVHHAEMHECRDLAIAEDVLRLLPAKIDLTMLDVLRPIGKRPTIEPNDSALTMQNARDPAPEPPADARDDDGSLRHPIPHVGRQKIGRER
jgi:hypothetical protein